MSAISDSYGSLRSVDPIPLNYSEEFNTAVDEDGNDSYSNDTNSPSNINDTRNKWFGIRFNTNSIINHTASIFQKVQRYSSYSFTGFFILHGLNVLVFPAIDLDISEEVMMMARDIYQKEFVEKYVVFGSVIAHVVSGVALRLLRILKRKLNSPSKRHVHRLHNNNTSATTGALHNNNHNSNNNAYQRRSSFKDHINLEKEIKFNPRTQDYEIKNDSVGLGGWFSVLNVGLRKSFITKRLGLSPLQFSGYLLVPLLTYHIASERLAPLFVDGDSSLINLKFVAHAISTGNKWISYPGFVMLIYVTLYHIVSGWLKWLKVYSIKKKKIWFLAINAMTVVGVFSLSRVVSMGPEYGSLAKSFDSYVGWIKSYTYV